MDYKVIHNANINNVEVILDGKKIGVIDYHYTQDRKVIMVTHTHVDPAHEGKGIAAAMTKLLLEYAKASQLKVLPICPYTKTYIERHPEYKDLLQ